MEATAARIKGSKATVMEGIGHFPMSENPELFRSFLLPVLDEIFAANDDKMSKLWILTAVL